MFQERSLKQDLAALALAAVAILVAMALATHNPADPLGEMLWPVSLVYRQDVAVYPLDSHVSNWCGRLGALVSDLAMRSLGLGAYYAAGSLAVLAVLLLTRRRIAAPVARMAGWLISLVGLTSLMSLLLAGLVPGPTIGPGGALGALAGGLLLGHFAAAGAVILSMTMLAAGLLLCTDYLLLQLAAAAGAPMARGVARGVKRQMERRRQAKDPVEAMSAALTEAAARGAAKAASSHGTPAIETGNGIVDESAAESGPRIKFLGKNRTDVETPTPAVSAADNVHVPDDVEEESDDAAAEGATDDDVAGEADADVEVDEEVREEVEAAEESAPSAVPAPKFLARQQPARLPGGAKALQQQQREEVMTRLDAASAEMADVQDYELPPIDLLLSGENCVYEEQEKEVRRKAKILEETFANFGFNVKVVEIETGPVIAQYEIELEAGLRLAKITNLADDLAIALRVPSVRIVAPIPGKNTVGIEVPNTNRQMVRLRDVMEEANGRAKKMAVPIYLGKDVSGHPMVEDLARMPHLLIAGRTGTGKSVCLNAIISSILMTRRPDEVRMLMIDPKMVELSGYGTLPHLMHPVVTDMRKAEAILAWAVEKMEERYALLARAGVRQISSYNQLGEEELYERLEVETEEEQGSVPLHLPYIVIVADEIADLMMVAGKDVEQHIIRLAQKSRAVGIHLILATQKPTVDVITGLIKSNLPARISFQVASRTDSRVVLDEMGADKLLGDGDMLFLKPGTSQLIRGQGTFLSDDEIEAIVRHVSTGEQNFVAELVSLKPKVDGEAGEPGKLKNRDELYEAAVDIVVRERRGSVSLLQRNLGIGYGRAARLIDFMAEDGIVGQYAGSQAREVLMSLEDWERMQGASTAAPAPSAGAATVSSVLSGSANGSSATFEDDKNDTAELPAPKIKNSPARKPAANARAAGEPQTSQPFPRPTIPGVKSVTRLRRTNRIIPVPEWDDDEETPQMQAAREEAEDEMESALNEIAAQLLHEREADEDDSRDIGEHTHDENRFQHEIDDRDDERLPWNGDAAELEQDGYAEADPDEDEPLWEERRAERA